MDKVYQMIAKTFSAYVTSCERSNEVWIDIHKDDIIQIVQKYFPSGSGFDSGTRFDFSKSKEDKLVFTTAFHHMNDGGYYDGWTEHEVIVTPSLAFGYNLKVTGRNKRDIKEYIAECFYTALNEKCNQLPLK